MWGMSGRWGDLVCLGRPERKEKERSLRVNTKNDISLGQDRNTKALTSPLELLLFDLEDFDCQKNQSRATETSIAKNVFRSIYRVSKK